LFERRVLDVITDKERSKGDSRGFALEMIMVDSGLDPFRQAYSRIVVAI
jgi:hypothetical protein